MHRSVLFSPKELKQHFLLYFFFSFFSLCITDEFISSNVHEGMRTTDKIYQNSRASTRFRSLTPMVEGHCVPPARCSFFFKFLFKDHAFKTDTVECTEFTNASTSHQSCCQYLHFIYIYCVSNLMYIFITSFLHFSLILKSSLQMTTSTYRSGQHILCMCVCV